MNEKFAQLGFLPGDILLPKQEDMTKWSVVACDQFTSQPEYWERVEEFVGGVPSTLRMILPESRLGTERENESIREINETMVRYLEQDLFETVADGLIYVERVQQNGMVRKGIVGVVDLEQYDYRPGASSLVRATEGTVLSRIPPRVAVRKDAPLEVSHIMVLFDDPRKEVIEPLGNQTEQMRPLYAFDLMEGGGSISGWQMTQEQMDRLSEGLFALKDPAVTAEKYNLGDAPVMLFAMGDGNHSLATAKECYERQKRVTAPEKWATLPSRYALAELVNLHDDSLEFEPIHRVVFGVKPEHVLEKLMDRYPSARSGAGEGHVIGYVFDGREGQITVARPKANLTVGTLQTFLDEYVKAYGGTIDYIHGADVTRQLAGGPGNIGFVLPAMEKEELFPTVMAEGVLPRKTFSMGEAWDKRYYLECRKIR